MTLIQLHIKFWGKRVLFVLTILILISLVYFFKVPEMKVADIVIKNPFYEYTSALTWKVYLGIYFTLVFLLNTVFLVSLTLFYKSQKRKHQRLIAKYENYFVETIIEHLMLKSFDVENEKDPHIESLLKSLKNKKAITILLDVLRKIHAQIKGELRMETNKLILDLGLHEIIRTYLHSPYFKDRVLALKIISDFQIKGHNKYILKLTLSKNYVLRTEALDSLIKLSVLDNLEFLKNHLYLVSLWDINTILKLSEDFEKHNIDYAGLINSDYPRVAALGILLANKNKQTGLKEMIKSKLGSRDEVLNREAYLAYLAMADQAADFKYVAEKFKGENEKVKHIVVDSFSKCPDKILTILFLIEVIEKESLSLKTKAMRLLLEFDTGKVQSYKHSPSLEVQKAHNEVVDLYLN